ncbi:DUF4859 domain-containing protein [Sphingobacterium bambusae]|uniref:DUF4859 domain-containing protein n=1 Tax=Sphingobacterium bambusae TaxID=662858 RepID=A0ABW6BIZ1_9SPHI|nr:DUF4859 domain-containing protein [Sphingobacterium bambusae]WPL47603.1 DUF4859 domain-containing protein [Sphingobacterium bambusae]
MMKNKLIKIAMPLLMLLGVGMTACNKALLDQAAAQQIQPLPGEETPADNDTLAIYVPQEFGDMNLYNNVSTWSYNRSRESTHFIVFWGAGYGTNDPNAAAVPEVYRVDIDDLLSKAEQFYAVNINTLKFAERGVGKSNLDKYKMMIFLHYTTEWMAYGGGYDDTIGALWINPATCKPVGSTIAHEIGHSFQYQVFADLKGGAGFRYGYGGDGGNAFWEQTAQWQAHQTYPAEAFSTYNFTVYTENYHRHIHHEWQRYASYFIHWYWADKHGIDIVGKIWRQAVQPEDPIQAYMRITGINVNQFNNEIYEAATRFVTWDLPTTRTIGEAYIGKHTNKFALQQNGSYRVTYDRCPGTTGYNVIPLELPAAGTQVTTTFKGLANAAGFNTVDASRAGWRYGYVALLNNGTRVYGDRHEGTENNVSFTIPANCSKLWFVVTGAPSVYQPHAWDEEESNDEQWPYEVKFTNTGILGFIDAGAEPRSVTLNKEVNFAYSATDYSGATVAIDAAQLAAAFAIQPTEVATLLSSGQIKFYAVEANGTLNATTTANGYGHWLDANGNVTTWGNNSVMFSEFNANDLSCFIGQYPGAMVKGNQYTIRQALVYTYATGKTAQATFVFKVNVQ